MKKRIDVILAVMVIAFFWHFAGSHSVFAQETDDVPYLSDDDIAAMELVLPDDIPYIAPETAGTPVETAGEVAAETEKSIERNEISRLNTSQTIYHLLILDRTYCPANSGIGGLDNTLVLYTFKHGRNGYLIAVYKSYREGPVFPLMPDKSRILVNLSTVRKNTILEYVDSGAFRKFVTSRRILSEIQNAMELF